MRSVASRLRASARRSFCIACSSRRTRWTAARVVSIAIKHASSSSSCFVNDRHRVRCSSKAAASDSNRLSANGNECSSRTRFRCARLSAVSSSSTIAFARPTKSRCARVLSRITSTPSLSVDVVELSELVPLITSSSRLIRTLLPREKSAPMRSLAAGNHASGLIHLPSVRSYTLNSSSSGSPPFITAASIALLTTSA